MKWMHLGEPRGAQRDVLLVDGKQVGSVRQGVSDWLWIVKGRRGHADTQAQAKAAAEKAYSESQGVPAVAA